MSLKLVPPREGKTPFWYVRGTYLGQSVDRSTKASDRRLAKRVIDKIKDEIERGEFAKPGEPTFLSAALEYVKAGGERRFIGTQTKSGEWTLLLGYFKEQPLRLIDQAALDRAALAIYPTATPATRNRQVYSVVSAILKQAGFDGKLRRPKGSRGNKRTDWLWPEQAFRLFRAADDIDLEFGAFLRTLCYTGMRLSEGLGLAIDNTRLSESFAYVAQTKNDDPRAVFLPPIVVESLANHPKGMDRTGRRVFRFVKGGRLYSLLGKAKAAAGPDVAFVGFHTFRHTWATWMRRYGGLDTRGLVGTGAWRDSVSAGRYEHVVVSEESRKAILLPTERKASA
jgi:integrase